MLWHVFHAEFGEAHGSLLGSLCCYVRSRGCGVGLGGLLTDLGVNRIFWNFLFLFGLLLQLGGELGTRS